MSSVGLILLAAGGSTRLGRAKQLLIHEGRTLIRRAAEAALASGCSPVVIVLGSEAASIEPELAGLAVDIIINEQWSTGMGGSIRRGMQAVLQERPGIAAVVIMLCDQPYVTSETIGALIAAHGESGAAVCASTYAGTFGPPCLFAAAQFGSLLGMAEDHGAKNVIAAGENVRWVPFEKGEIDIDTPEDAEKLG